MSEREIEFKDIRVGDTIRREWVHRKVKLTCEGKITAINTDYLRFDLEGGTSWSHSEGCTYILVDRPKPPLPTEPGSVIKVTKFKSRSGEWLARFTGNDRWSLFDLVGGDDEFWTNQCHIEEWRHVEIREVTL